MELCLRDPSNPAAHVANMADFTHLYADRWVLGGGVPGTGTEVQFFLPSKKVISWYTLHRLIRETTVDVHMKCIACTVEFVLHCTATH